MRIRISVRPTTASSPEALRIAPAAITVRHRAMRVLDFDCECRPLSFLGSDFMTKEITAIAWAWADAPERVSVVLLGEMTLTDMLLTFVRDYDRADLVTGHYIRGFDLPLINGALMEQMLPVLGSKMTHDTKGDLVRSHGISLSQESLGAMLHLEHKKVQMNQGRWREANRLTQDGLTLTRERVTGDVRQHVEMRRELLALDYLAAPKRWESGTAKAEQYTP